MLSSSDGDHLGLPVRARNPLCSVCRRPRSLGHPRSGVGALDWVLKSDNAAMQIISIGPLDLRGHDLTDA
jgi:hypothetical protein